MTKRFTLCLHLALAKSVAEYLSEAGDDKDKALEAARRDVVQREGQNSKARAFQRSYSKLIEKLKLPVDPEDPDAASDAALEAIKGMSDAGANSAQILAALKKAGLDPAKIEEQVQALRTEAAQGAEGVKLKRELAYRDAADALGYDAGKLTKILRDEQGLPEKRTVTTKNEAGEEVKTDTWGIPSIDAAGKETGFTALAQHADVKGFEASLKKADAAESAAAQTQPGFVQPGPSLPAQRGGQPVNTSGVKVDPASLNASIAANGAGSI